MTPMLVPCSRSAHDQNVLAQRPQWDQHGCHSRDRASELKGIVWKIKSRQTRAVGIIPAPPYGSGSLLRLCLGQGASMGEEAVLVNSGRAGEKDAFLSILR